MPYFKLNCRITFNDEFTLGGLHSVEIKKSVFSLVDTCTLAMPSQFIAKKTRCIQGINLRKNCIEGKK